MFLTVFTPTYNRAYILKNCFESLKWQTCRDFEWIVVDDGSTDNTYELVQSFIDDADFPIRYYYQKNSGKHIAHNLAGREAKGELFLCLDSDDMLTETAVETAKEYWARHGDVSYTGILAKRGSFTDRTPICGSWDASLKSSTMFALRTKHRFSGDTALFFRSALLRQVSFKSFPNETFLPENNLYDDIDSFGEMLLLDEVVYLCEYLSDGLTARYHELLCKNPLGTADTFYKEMNLASGCTDRIKFALLTNMYASLSSDRRTLSFQRHRFLLACTYLPAIAIRGRFFRKLNHNGATEESA